MKSLLYLFVIFMFLNCNSTVIDSKKKELDSNKSELTKTEPKIPYSEVLNRIKLAKLNSTEKKNRFFQFINKDIPSYWTGTAWDFNGVTRTPQKGEIACGYFVTNTLTDFGFNLKRIWLAQQASSVMIKELCAKNTVKRYSNIEQVKSYLKQQKEQDVFIVGLDFHTGYIIKDGTQSYFLHSNYIDREGVIKETIEESKALNSSKSFMIGSLTQNNKLFTK